MKNRYAVPVCFFFFLAAIPATPQTVEVTKDGQHLLHLSPAQQSAVDAFLKLHPGMKQVGCPTTGPDANYCKIAYTQWEAAVKGQDATPQFPTVAWGDFRGKGTIDFAVAFHSEKVVNSFGGRLSEVVVFENLGGDRYSPVVALSGAWGNCLDGMLFHPARKQLEMWCNTATAYSKWNGSAFVGHTKAGD
jgi:hypothetical protein